MPPTLPGVRCPLCQAALLVLPASQPGEARCPGCAAGFAMADGILDLLAAPSPRRSPAQVAMEWGPLVRIYESRLWRRSPLFAALMRISFEREYELIAGSARLTRDARVLDLACGPGIYTRRFANTASRGAVVGLDVSLPMLRHAARRLKAAGLGDVLLIHGTALELPFEADTFDVVNCCGAVHLFPDLASVLREVARVLRPGGRFTAAAFRRREGRVADWATRLRRRRLGIDAFRPDELAERLAAAGLVDARCHHAAGIWLIMSAVKPGGQSR